LLVALPGQQYLPVGVVVERCGVVQAVLPEPLAFPQAQKQLPRL
jgi:hypothetical protein